MTRNKFAIGQTVDFARRLPSISRPTGPYEVVSVLPADEADSPTYRVKSQAEPFARAVRETDLVAVGLAPSELGRSSFRTRVVSAAAIAVTASRNFTPSCSNDRIRLLTSTALTRRTMPEPHETTKAAAFPRPTE
jgi:hypothetical protein